MKPQNRLPTLEQHKQQNGGRTNASFVLDKIAELEERVIELESRKRTPK